MAINQNHLFEELNGVKCAIVEKNASPARVDFLRGILEYNHFTVVVTPSPPPKAAPAPAAAPSRPADAAATPAPAAAPSRPADAAAIPAPAAAGPAAPAAAAAVATPLPLPVPPSPATETTVPPPPAMTPAAPPPPSTFTVGVTDVTFNPVNAIFGRLLHTPDGHVVTLAYWQQKDSRSNDAIPYFN